MIAGDRLVCTIEKCVYGGDGLARVEGCVLFVPGVLPGEVAEVEIIQTKRSFSRGRLVRLEKRSPDRITPCCRVDKGTLVPGCVYDHADYGQEVRMKQAQLLEMVGHLPGVDASRFLPPLAAASPLHYRNKIVLHGGRGKGLRLLGYFREPDHSVVDIPACPLAVEPINEALKRFRSSPVWKGVRKGAEVLFRYTPNEGAGWYSKVLRGGTLLPMLTENTAFGTLFVPATGFFQVNVEMADILLKTLAAWFREEADSFPVIADCFCGVGGLGLACMKSGGEKLYGLESGREAVHAARANAKAWGVPATYDCLAWGRDSVDWSRLTPDVGQTTLIVDPPRGGMAASVAREIASSGIPRLFYVSCDPATLTRDLRILINGGYAVRRVQLIDLFPRTARFETLVELAL